MGDKTGIEWTDATWNAVRGCTRVSEGCRNCYAETVAHRFSGEGQPYEGLIKKGRWNGQVKFVREHLLDPLRWKRPRKVFVNSMSDVFHEGFTNEQIAAQFAVMCAAPRHSFQVLTKRPARMREFFLWLTEGDDPDEMLMCSLDQILERGEMDDVQLKALDRIIFPEEGWASAYCAPHIMIGVSIEDQRAADERLPYMAWLSSEFGFQTFVSCEPLLGAVELGAYAEILDWVIVGGESGAGARPMRPEWARALRDECHEADTPFFFKQWGQWAPGAGGELVRHAHKGDAGALLDGAECRAWPAAVPVERLGWQEVAAALTARQERVQAAGLAPVAGIFRRPAADV